MLRLVILLFQAQNYKPLVYTEATTFTKGKCDVVDLNCCYSGVSTLIAITDKDSIPYRCGNQDWLDISLVLVVTLVASASNDDVDVRG